MENENKDASFGSISPIAFLGAVERYSLQREGGDPPLTKHNVIGLKHYYPSMLYPISIGDLHYAVALHKSILGKAIGVKVLGPTGRSIGDLGFSMSLLKNGEASSVQEQVSKRGSTINSGNLGDWTFTVIPPATGPTALIDELGTYSLDFTVDGLPAGRAYIDFLLIKPLPLDEARITAIRSKLEATHFLRYRLNCDGCGDSIKAYVGVEESTECTDEGYIWYTELPDRFQCRCRRVDVSLILLRETLPSRLGETFEESGSSVASSLYEKSTLIGIFKNFKDLIEDNPNEEAIQVFIKENPIILSLFNAELIIPKAPILTFHKTDFAVLTPSRELLLIELEKSTTKILKRDGGTHSELQHAFDQTRDWIHAMNEHRIAALECMHLKQTDVAKIRGVVIAGRDIGQDPEHLRRLKSRADFLTYDDLLASLSVLATRISRL